MFKYFGWIKRNKTERSEDAEKIPSSFNIDQDNKLININMAVKDDLVDISTRTLTYAEVAAILIHQQPNQINSTIPRVAPARTKSKGNSSILLDDSTELVKPDHYSKKRTIKKKQYKVLQQKKIESNLRKQAT